MLKAVVFDLDGVLYDAVEWHFVALNRALSLVGFQISREEHAANYNGLPTSVKLDKLSECRGLPRGLHPLIQQMKQVHTQEILDQHCVPNPAIEQLLLRLKQRGLKLAVASNSIRATVERVLAKMEIRKYFDVVYCSEDVQRAKPNPEIYLKTFAALHCDPEACMVVEDSAPGIRAARSATPNVIVVSGPSEVTWERLNAFIEKANATEFTSAPPIEIVIPMAGQGQRFYQAGYAKPKPLIEIFGQPMIQWVVENLRPRDRQSHFTFVCNQSHLTDYRLRERLNRIAPGCSIVPVPAITQGAACTVLLARDQISTSRPLLIANSDQWVEASLDAFLADADTRAGDGMIMTFPARDSKWSFAQVDDAGLVTAVAEKNPISENATVGIYYFQRGSDFIDGAESMIRKNIRTNGEFYVCPVYNELIERRKRILTYPIPAHSMHGLGTPEDLAQFLNSPPPTKYRRPPELLRFDVADRVY